MGLFSWLSGDSQAQQTQYVYQDPNSGRYVPVNPEYGAQAYAEQQRQDYYYRQTHGNGAFRSGYGGPNDPAVAGYRQEEQAWRSTANINRLQNSLPVDDARANHQIFSSNDQTWRQLGRYSQQTLGGLGLGGYSGGYGHHSHINLGQVAAGAVPLAGAFLGGITSMFSHTSKPEMVAPYGAPPPPQFASSAGPSVIVVAPPPGYSGGQEQVYASPQPQQGYAYAQPAPPTQYAQPQPQFAAPPVQRAPAQPETYFADPHTPVAAGNAYFERNQLEALRVFESPSVSQAQRHETIRQMEAQRLLPVGSESRPMTAQELAPALDIYLQKNGGFNLPGGQPTVGRDESSILGQANDMAKQYVAPPGERVDPAHPSQHFSQNGHSGATHLAASQTHAGTHAQPHAAPAEIAYKEEDAKLQTAILAYGEATHQKFDVGSHGKPVDGQRGEKTDAAAAKVAVEIGLSGDKSVTTAALTQALMTKTAEITHNGSQVAGNGSPHPHGPVKPVAFTHDPAEKAVGIAAPEIIQAKFQVESHPMSIVHEKVASRDNPFGLDHSVVQDIQATVKAHKEKLPVASVEEHSGPNNGRSAGAPVSQVRC